MSVVFLVTSDSVTTLPPFSSTVSVGVSSSMIRILSWVRMPSGEFRDSTGGISFSFNFTKSSALSFSLFAC